MIIHLVSEDLISEAIMSKMISYFYKDDLLYIPMGKRGRGYIKNKINKINNMKSHLPFFILADLDTDLCAPGLIAKWIKQPCRNNLIIRIAVREVEAWLLADTEGFSNYLNIEHSFIIKEVNSPDLLPNPKEKLIHLVERSKKRKIKNDIVRYSQKSLTQGPGYNTRLSEYIHNVWNINRASKKSDSFNRAKNAIKIFCENLS